MTTAYGGATGGAISAELDTSELDDLNAYLTRAAATVEATRAVGLTRAAATVLAEAKAAASGWGTGALAADLNVSGTRLTKRVGSTLREAFFLEYGSPTTGGPRPYLTAPAQREMSALLVALGKAATP